MIYSLHDNENASLTSDLLGLSNQLLPFFTEPLNCVSWQKLLPARGVAY